MLSEDWSEAPTDRIFLLAQDEISTPELPGAPQDEVALGTPLQQYGAGVQVPAGVSPGPRAGTKQF